MPGGVVAVPTLIRLLRAVRRLVPGCVAHNVRAIGWHVGRRTWEQDQGEYDIVRYLDWSQQCLGKHQEVWLVLLHRNNHDTPYLRIL